jgi:nitrogen fixation protein FixH
MKKGWYWPLLIVALLFVGGVGPNLLLFVVANSDPSFSVEPDYYQKSLRWDERLAQERRNSELGWTLGLDLRPEESPQLGVRLTAMLFDRTGAPLDGASVELEAFHNARASEIVKASLRGSGEGTYLANLPAGRAGLWEFRFVVRLGNDVFTRTVMEDVWPAI